MAQLNDLVVTGKSRFLNTIGGTIEKSEQVKVSKTSNVNSYGLLFSEFPSGTSDYSNIHINEFITVDPTPANLYVRRNNSNGFSLHAEGGTGVNYMGLSSGSNGGLQFYGYKQGNTNSPDITMTGSTWDGSNDSLVTAVTSAKDTVKQNVLSTASTNSYKILLSGSADTSAHTEGVYKYSTLEFTPDNNESVLDGNTLSMYNNSWETVIRLSCGTNPYVYVKDSSPKYLKAYNTDIVLGDWNGTSNTWDGTNTSLVTAVTQLKNTKADILAETIPNLTFSGGVATLAKKTGYILISIYPYARSDDGYGITSFTEQNDGSYKIRNNYGGLNASLKARAIWLKV